MDPEEEARLAAEAEAAAQAEAAAAEAAAKAAADADKDKSKDKPSDETARLLKDAMKFKERAKEAAKEAADAKERLARFDGIDPDEVRAMLEEKKANELSAAEKRGEYDRIIKQVREDADNRVKAEKEAADAVRQQLAEARERENDLVIGLKFSSSKFLADETVLPPTKARKIYGDHFEIEDGEPVAYDKPRGAKERTPLVDASTGNKLNFEAALEKILKGDSDFESIAKSKMKTGANATPSTGGKTTTGVVTPVPLKGVSIIAKSLQSRAAPGKPK